MAVLVEGRQCTAKPRACSRRIVRADSGMFQDVEVAPAVDFSTLDEVLVLTEGSRAEARADALVAKDGVAHTSI